MISGLPGPFDSPFQVNACAAQFYTSAGSASTSARNICNIFCWVQLGSCCLSVCLQFGRRREQESWPLFGPSSSWFKATFAWCITSIQSECFLDLCWAKLTSVRSQQRKDHNKYDSIYLAWVLLRVVIRLRDCGIHSVDSEPKTDSIQGSRDLNGSQDDLHAPTALYAQAPNYSSSSLRNEVQMENENEKHYAAGGYSQQNYSSQPAAYYSNSAYPQALQPGSYQDRSFANRNQEVHPSFQPYTDNAPRHQQPQQQRGYEEPAYDYYRSQ